MLQDGFNFQYFNEYRIIQHIKDKKYYIQKRKNRSQYEWEYVYDENSFYNISFDTVAEAEAKVKEYLQDDEYLIIKTY